MPSIKTFVEKNSYHGITTFIRDQRDCTTYRNRSNLHDIN